MKVESIVFRIKQIADNENIPITSFEKIIGASSGTLSRALRNGTDIQSKWVQLIIENYPHYNAEWLLTGKGEMLNFDKIAKNTIVTGDSNFFVGGNIVKKGNIKKNTDSNDTAHLSAEIEHLKIVLAEKEKQLDEKERIIQILINK